jgi:hypothetical protein
MELVEVLLGLLTVMTTVVLTVVGALYRELILNIKPDLQAVRSTLFGTKGDSTDDGLVQDVECVDTKIEESAAERREEHEQVEHRLDRMGTRLDAVISALKREDDIEIHVQAGDSNQREEN